jgi:hypothetical protein
MRLLSFLALAVVAVWPMWSSHAYEITLGPGIPIEDPPKDVAKKKPSAEDYNALLRDFLGSKYVDLAKEEIDPRLAELFKNDKSNDVYNRFKLKEKAYNGSIHVSPVVIDNQQIIVVAARIVYGGSLRKTMRSETLRIVFDARGKFIEVRRGPSMKQDLG